MTELKRCVKCTYPETFETIEFDEHGVCNICRNFEFKDQHIDWADRKKDLDELVEKYRGKYDYDCLVPFSGGKDSTFTLWYLVTVYKLKPLVIQFDHGFMRPGLLENNERTFKKLGVDVIKFTPNWKVVKKLMLAALIEKGDFCWHCHTGIFSYPMHVAIKYKVPLIFWGEPSAEYTAHYSYKDNEIETVDEERFNKIASLGISADDMFEIINTEESPIDRRDLNPFTYPDVNELKKINYHSVCLGSYIPWDVQKNSAIIMKELGWKGSQVEGIPEGMWPYEKIECFMQGVRDYIKYIKRGYSRITQMTALDIRHGRMSRDEAMLLIEQYEGVKPRTLEVFLEYLDLTESEFNEIVLKTAVPPYQHKFTNKLAEKIGDFDACYREGCSSCNN